MSLYHGWSLYQGWTLHYNYTQVSRNIIFTEQRFLNINILRVWACKSMSVSACLCVSVRVYMVCAWSVYAYVSMCIVCTCVHDVCVCVVCMMFVCGVHGVCMVFACVSVWCVGPRARACIFFVAGHS